MPITKNAITRFRILDRCFRNHYKKYFIEDLMEECSRELGVSISRRTIFNDINYIESAYDVLIERVPDGKRIFYRYKNVDYSINNSPLSSVEIAQLQSCIEVISQFRGLPQLEWINEIIDKLQLSSDKRANDIVEFDTNIDLKGQNYVGEIYHYIVNKVVLNIEYHAFDWLESRIIVFHPHYLKQYNNRWFLFGYNADLAIEGWTMALDRICKIEPAQGVKFKQSSISWREYFDDIIGVTNYIDAPVEEIVLHCYGITGKYIETKPIHPSQHHKWISEECLQVKLFVKQNFELENFILGQGDGVKVISPLTLQNKIRLKISRMDALYKQVNSKIPQAE